MIKCFGRMPETLVAQRTQKTKVVGVTIRLEKIQFTETKTMTLFQLKDACKNGILSETFEPPFFNFRYFHDGIQVAKTYLTSS